MSVRFETLEILSQNNSTEITELKVRVTKDENKLKEINTAN
ncbi:Uncharacterised protein [[Clostridium] sordellii]|nr:Uncharacterised protein [[Clostridium] sordellii] [Paeniclostridium sordellii]